MVSDQRTAQCIIDMVRAVWWTDDLIDESWYVGLTPEPALQLEVYRAILEVTSKVVCNICRGRLGMHCGCSISPQP
jgi:hypothetical protein